MRVGEVYQRKGRIFIIKEFAVLDRRVLGNEVYDFGYRLAELWPLFLYLLKYG